MAHATCTRIRPSNGLYSVLDVTTGHMTAEDNEILHAVVEATRDPDDRDGQRNSIHGLRVADHQYGYMIFIFPATEPTDMAARRKSMTEHGLSKSFARIVAKADRVGAWAIIFDRDGQTHEDLDNHDW